MTRKPNRLQSMSVARVHPLYVAKVERKGRTRAEVDEIVRWLTGYTQEEMEVRIERQVDFETFFAEAPRLNPASSRITGVVCGVRVEEIEDPGERRVRMLDKLVDELAKGRSMASILRKEDNGTPR
jgi:hypothetical protein